MTTEHVIAEGEGLDEVGVFIAELPAVEEVSAEAPVYELSMDDASGFETMPITTSIEVVRSITGAVEQAAVRLSNTEAMQESVTARMRKFQAMSDEVSLTLVQAEAVEREAIDAFRRAESEALSVRLDYEDALECLREAQEFADEQRRLYEEKVAIQNEREAHVPPACIEVRALRTRIEELQLLGANESVKQQEELARRKRELIANQLELAKARLNILSDPKALVSWSEIRPVLEVA